MSESVIEIIVAVLLIIGVSMILLSAIGLLRLPDIYTRSHGATKSATLGVLSTLVAVFIYFGALEGFYNVRVLLGIVFVFLTAPVAGHLCCRAAYRSGTPLAEESVQDDLKEILGDEEQRRNQRMDK
ncbi:multicomponent Na+:H+ antiporter subunit G [Geomicrobium halophilum]|uniref:Multicomponent Na+:H+ antiporter subunit G n=1 Tax=Geomicrobium halophilum TaxID=549000 RepID=A0A841Q0P8_9BACL|nr:monovalent cation/H(+) antiporter subunit G [Geomicrobium halophilum]MBB6451212.1 multicomponent Na+:H+ antiporter subunit G [Geomicrobium halophilum]